MNIFNNNNVHIATLRHHLFALRNLFGFNAFKEQFQIFIYLEEI
jgi:hypothetical protein